jgi:hypothetical protein
MLVWAYLSHEKIDLAETLRSGIERTVNKNHLGSTTDPCTVIALKEQH